MNTDQKHCVDPHCFDADPEPDPDPAQSLDADGGGVGQLKMCIPPCKILGTPLREKVDFGIGLSYWPSSQCSLADRYDNLSPPLRDYEMWILFITSYRCIFFGGQGGEVIHRSDSFAF